MPSSNGQRQAPVRIIERIVVAAAPPRTPPPLMITFRPRVPAARMVTSPTPDAVGREAGAGA